MTKVERLLRELYELNKVSKHENEEIKFIYQLLREKASEVKVNKTN